MSAPRWGHVAEWLRNGLQNRVLRFNSGRGLHQLPSTLTIFACRPAGHDASNHALANGHAAEARAMRYWRLNDGMAMSHCSHAINAQVDSAIRAYIAIKQRISKDHQDQ